MPKELLLPDRTYAFFSHTIKAQPYNMPLLDAMLEKNIRLFDYEKILSEDGRRLVQFGQFAGLAGAIDSLHVLGERLLMRDGYSTPFINIGFAKNYSSLEMAKEAVRVTGEQIRDFGLPAELSPFVIVTTGAGAVARGFNEILDFLPCKFIESKDLPRIWNEAKESKKRQQFVYVLKATAKDMVRHKTHPEKPFDKTHYYENPHEYEGVFHENVMPYTSLLLNGMYWDARFPQLVTLRQARELIDQDRFPLVVVGDVSCDIRGSVEFLSRPTSIPDPFYICDIIERKSYANLAIDKGVAMLGVDNWPAAFPKSASTHFGNCLAPLVPPMAQSDMTASYEEQRKTLLPSLHQSMVTLHNNLTPAFEYINDLRKQHKESIVAAQNKGNKVLVLGSGYVVSPVVDYLLKHNHITRLTVAGNDVASAKGLVDNFVNLDQNNKDRLLSAEVDVTNDAHQSKLEKLIQEHDIVLSLVPAPFHPIVAKQCIKNKKDMITASYISPEMKELHDQAREAGIVILNEIGLDPGIDHMGVMKIIDEVKSEGRKIVSFVSYCGALPAPEASDNVLGYKFSWSPRGVLVASQNPARFITDGEVVEVTGDRLMFSAKKLEDVHLNYPAFSFEVVPNRDSVSYVDYYGLDRSHLKTMMRGTLRFPGFTNVFKGLKVAGMLSMDAEVHSNIESWFDLTKQLTGCLASANEAQLENEIRKLLEHKFEELGMEKQDATRDAAYAASGFKQLGLLSKENTIDSNVTNSKVIDLLSKHLEKQLSYKASERDLVYMHHEFVTEDDNEKKETITSTLCVFGDNDKGGYSATAKTVAYPMAIATERFLSGKLDELKGTGVIGPTAKVLYEQVLSGLEKEGIHITEKKL